MLAVALATELPHIERLAYGTATGAASGVLSPGSAAVALASDFPAILAYHFHIPKILLRR